MSGQAEALCPCGSGRLYGDCCQPLHQGQPAATAEALMRSRYTAFVFGLQEYLLESWDSRTRPAELPLDNDTRWFGLTVHDSQQDGDRATVSFSARFCEGKDWFSLSEVSAFALADDGHWRYVDGKADFQPLQTGRNDLCPCGSEKKYKKCCGA
ncbi:YchJ family protein [Thalassolituus alkanivorans]|uniref:YchJ family protein n=1 Tax=Thalassolituus alkanivorans TaxID=2881055 RepID=UPI001E4C9D78|nr:YchJ family metal-binding protein [Thalassolituus alkanivorans]MCB2388602.1 SEC-C domain-containing protein [Thalassolituus alkanivorans]MCB2423679.1 SEC-C domain-containing protein [Thalassolituus alkanivorans]